MLPAYRVARDGLVLPKGFPVESVESGLDYKAQAGDVFVIGFPGSGFLCFRYILFLLKNQGLHLGKRQRLGDSVPHLELTGKDVVEKLDQPRIIGSNLPRSHIPFSTDARYIYVARNPADCCISFYNYARESSQYYEFHEGRFDTFFDLFINGKTDFGDYFDHLLSWYERRNDPNVLFLLCEDLATDFGGLVKKIGKFLGGVFEEATESERIMNDVARMAGGKDPGNKNDGIQEELKLFGKKIGDWEKYFSDQQIISLEEKTVGKLGQSGASELWRKYGC